MVLKITNLHILRYLPTYWLYLLERYTIDNQRCTHTLCVCEQQGGKYPLLIFVATLLLCVLLLAYIIQYINKL